MMNQDAQRYDPDEHEERIYAAWEKKGVFKPSPAKHARGQKPYVIMLPPPNITGSLHVGHALQDTIMDIASRYHRMKGERVLWQPGTDHAAIATNRVLEEQLKKAGKSRQQLGREKFLELADAWYRDTGSTIINQMKRLGCSCDWSRLRFTMDPEYVQAVQEAFVRYFERGYIYRGNRIVNWDPSTQTTVSDLEIEWKTEKAPFYTLQYGPFHISTARPETKFGDKYVVMHPSDKRYAAYKEGDTFACEWINGPITATVIKDEAVDPKFGSGVMTMTPWHDATDFEIAQRHKLASEQIIGFDGKLQALAQEFSGMTIEEARPKIIEKLRAKGLLVKIDENYEHNIARNERGGIVEPQVMRQWFVDMSALKQETIAAIENDLVRFSPPRWKRHTLEWMRNVHDWTISRQIWLGQRIPVWWKPGTRGTENEKGNYLVSIERPAGLPAEAPPKGVGEGWQQDPDVLDTWFSSAIWPLATLGWPQHTEDLKTFYPTALLTTAREILYLWVARMMFSGLELLKGKEYGSRTPARRIPFRTVVIHPVVLAKDGRRMSKSLGTGIDPLELIKQYGADATRFGLMYQIAYDSQAVRFDPNAIKSARNFANKIWNLARLVQTLKPRQEEATIADAWIMHRTLQVTAEISALLDAMKIGEAARVLYEFVWHDFADWYAEILKVKGSPRVAREVFTSILKLVHPFMPHLSELLWPAFGGDGLLMTSSWPSSKRTAKRASITAAIARFQDIVNSVRSTRTLLSIPAGAEVVLHLKSEKRLHALYDALAALCRGKIVSEVPAAAITIPLATGGTITFASEHITAESKQRSRLRVLKEQEKLGSAIMNDEKTAARMSGKASAAATAAVHERVAKAKKRRKELEKNLKLLE